MHRFIPEQYRFRANLTMRSTHIQVGFANFENAVFGVYENSANHIGSGGLMPILR